MLNLLAVLNYNKIVGKERGCICHENHEGAPFRTIQKLYVLTCV